MEQLLSRDEFRNGVFQRDNHLCVICGNPATAAHHIVERRLFSDGGYYINNGASLCDLHHWMAESTELSCEEIRAACGIKSVVLPEHLYPDMRYDKWGNPFISDAFRLMGELMDDESVRKVIKGDFSNRVKFPRTYHLPYSPSVSKDDKQMADDSFFHGKNVVLTMKMDGENTTMYRDSIHARSLDSRSHPSRDWVKNLWSEKVAYKIDARLRICGENLYAKHSISYKKLISYFMVFSVWEDLRCLDWDDTQVFSEILELKHVPVLYRGLYDRRLVERIASDVVANGYCGEDCEGVVLRVEDDFHLRDYSRAVGKYVRANHVQTHSHWTRTWEKNQLDKQVKV